jgi:hypothetical protein
MHASRASRVDRRSFAAGGGTIAVLVVTGLVAGSLVVSGNTGTGGGVQSPASFLAHFQETGVLAATTPAPVPVVLSAVLAAPSRLPAAGGAYLADAGVAGHLAIEWTFSETVGIAISQELEVSLNLEYDVGAVTHTSSLTVYAETQAVAIGGTLTFDLYWDAGAATGITFVSQAEIVQACAAVGTCP